MDIRKTIEEKCNIVIESIKLIGEGYDSKAYIVNNEYVFKIKFSANKKKGYEKEYEKAYSNVDVGFGMLTDVLCAGICSKRRRIFFIRCS